MQHPVPLPVFPVGALPLAHQGGWDEILMVVAPLAVIGGLLWMANKRVTAQIAADEAATALSEGPADDIGGHGSS